MAPFDAVEIAALEASGIEVTPLTAAEMRDAAAMEWIHDGHDHHEPFDRRGLSVVTCAPDARRAARTAM